VFNVSEAKKALGIDQEKESAKEDSVKLVKSV